MVELRAQVEMALALGIDVTHVDTHMGAVLHPQLMPAYVRLAVEYRIPLMLPRLSEEGMARWGVEPEMGRSLLAWDTGALFIPALWPRSRGSQPIWAPTPTNRRAWEPVRVLLQDYLLNRPNRATGTATSHWMYGLVPPHQSSAS